MSSDDEFEDPYDDISGEEAVGPLEIESPVEAEKPAEAEKHTRGGRRRAPGGGGGGGMFEVNVSAGGLPEVCRRSAGGLLEVCQRRCGLDCSSALHL